MLVCVNVGKFFYLQVEWRGLPGIAGLRLRMPETKDSSSALENAGNSSPLHLTF